MHFNSIQFLFFFIIVTTLYFNIPNQRRWILLLISSCYFYMAFVPIYILILGFTIVIDYFAGILIENAQGSRRKQLLIISLIANIGVLAVFKYYNFLNDNLSYLLHGFGSANPIPYLNILLPIGLSFHTFQAMSYTIEVYRGNQKAERHFGIYALYVLFYPQLVVGPIERPQNLLPQFRANHKFEYIRVVEGLKLMFWGFFKKLVIADRLAIYVNSVYNNSAQHTGITLSLATIFFTFQIYCDFSGYSDIAIGAANVMGFDLMTNFKRPYLSKTIAEFWQRWHISLSTWFRDYVYISLGGSRVSIPRWYFNVMLIFLISGLWHGANWTYIIWGGLNGFYLVFAMATEKWRHRLNQLLLMHHLPKIHSFIQICLTFLLICFSLVFFRSDSLHTAMTILKKMTSFKGGLFIGDKDFMVYSIMAILILIFVEVKGEYFSDKIALLHNKNIVVRFIVYTILMLYMGLFGAFFGGQFFYFQF